MPLAVEHIVIVDEQRDMHEPFDEKVLELNEKAEARNARYEAVEGVSDLVLHELAFLEVGYLPFGFHRLSFPDRSVVGGNGKHRLPPCLLMLCVGLFHQ